MSYTLVYTEFQSRRSECCAMPIASEQKNFGLHNEMNEISLSLIKVGKVHYSLSIHRSD